MQDKCSAPLLPSCPDGFYIDPISQAQGSPYCNVCPEGHHCRLSVLHPCPWGTPPAPRMSYTVSQCVETRPTAQCLRTASAVVLPCPINTVNLNARGRTPAWCHPDVGYYGMRGAPATKCPTDFYCPGATTAPIPCPASSFSDPGSALCTADMWAPCRPGWYIPFVVWANGDVKVRNP
jgi:hypothetical protein